MQERASLEEVFEGVEEKKGKGRYILLIVLGFGILSYILYLLFGNNSWEVLLKLRTQKKELETRVEKIQHENVELQKVIFELKGLEPVEE